MAIEALLATVNPTHFTGYQHMQIVRLLTVLSLVSIVVWGLVLLSMMLRFVVIMIIRRTSRRLAAQIEQEPHHGS